MNIEYEVLDVSVVEKYLTKLGSIKSCKSVKDLVAKYDSDNDGILSLDEFIEMINKSTVEFKPFTTFKDTIMKKTLGEDGWKTIEHRYRHITEIKTYRKEHEGKYPEEDWVSALIRFCSGSPHPDKYDYEMRHDVGKGIISEITQTIIAKLKRLNPEILTEELKHCNTSFCNTPEVLLMKHTSHSALNVKMKKSNSKRTRTSTAHHGILPGAISDDDDAVTTFNEDLDA